MGGREHIRIDTVQDAVAASFRRIFFVVDFEATSQEVLRVLKRLEVLLGMFGGSQGNGSLIRPEIYPPMYKGTCARQKVSEKFSALLGENCTAWDWE